MAWIELQSLQQLPEIVVASFTTPQIIFKHSTRCSVSVMIKNRLDKEDFSQVAAHFYYLDLLNYRAISNKVAEDFHVFHESPQILIIKNGECVYDESHLAITFDDLTEHLLSEGIKN